MSGHGSVADLVNFLAPFHSLSSLRITFNDCDGSENPTFASSILLGVVNPTRLSSLHIYCVQNKTAPHAIGDVIPRFSQLLSFTTHTANYTEALSRSLAKLSKLKHVEVVSDDEEGSAFQLSYLAIKTMLVGPYALPSLSTLRLPSPYSNVGDSHLEEDYEPTYDRSTGRLVLDSAWYPATWSNECSMDQAKELVEFSAEKGLELGGDLVEVMGECDAYFGELEWCNAQPGVRLVDR